MADFTFKIIVIGQAGVGKTAIVRRFVREFFPEDQQPTIGIDIGIKLVEIDGYKIQLKIWDSAGSERFRSLATSYYRNADAAVLVYSIDNSESLYALQSWSSELNNNGDNLIRFLVGNKNDLFDERKVSEDLAINFALLENMDIAIECSAKSDENIKFLFNTLASKLLIKKREELKAVKEQKCLSRSLENIFLQSTPTKRNNGKPDESVKSKKNFFLKLCRIL